MIIVANFRHNKSSSTLCRIGKKFKYIDRNFILRMKKVFQNEACTHTSRIEWQTLKKLLIESFSNSKSANKTYDLSIGVNGKRLVQS
jgi:hypothetical protein